MPLSSHRPPSDVSQPEEPQFTAAEAVQVLTNHAMTRIFDLTGEIPGGSHEDRAMLATAIVGEILARSLAGNSASTVAELTNTILAARRLGWRVVLTS